MFVNINNTISVKGETGAYTDVEKMRLLYIWKSTMGTGWAVVSIWYNFNYDDSDVICTRPQDPFSLELTGSEVTTE
jgi:hypothetical protein